MEKITFSHNWNVRGNNGKLDCKAFTTIRLENALKYKIGHFYEIWEGQKFRGTAKIVSIHNFQRDDLTELVAYLDTGYNREEVLKLLSKMYPFCKSFTKFSLIGLVYDDKPLEQKNLF